MNKVKIIVYENGSNFINYLINNNIYYYDLECKDNYTLTVSLDNYKKIKRRFKTSIIRYYGKVGIVYFFDFHKYMIVSIILSLFVLYLLSNTIFNVEIISDNKEICNTLTNDLKDFGIYKYKRKKSFEELVDIKNKILEKNKDLLEWIEIIESGSTYKVEITPKIIINKNKSKLKESSIYAKKSGLIKRIIVYKGSKIKEKNDYVKKGDLLISGNILKDDKVVLKIKSSGIVYAEVWYLAKVNIPFEMTKKEYTGKSINHYYLDINGFKFTIIGKYDNKNTVNEKKLIIKKPYLLFDIYKENKKIYKDKTYKISQTEAYEIAIKEAELKIKEKLKDDEYIISKNVLKKEVNSSKMYIEVFFKVYENIGYTSNIDKIGENNARSN